MLPDAAVPPAGVAPAHGAPPERAGLAEPDGLARARFAAMGTTVAVLAPTGRADALGLVRAVFAEWEQTLSRFRADSELSRLNARAGEAVPVSPLLFAVTQTALAAAATTRGVFDPSLLRQLIAVGYDRSFESLPAFMPARAGVPVPGGGWAAVHIDGAARAVRLPIGTMLDFGGIAKGMAADAALHALVAAGVTPAAVDAGGDVAVTPTADGAEPWSIAIGTDADDGTRSATRRERVVALSRGAIATSSVARRRWRQGSDERHHLLDPRTGLPSASDLRSVTAIAGDCAQAEVAAKVALILGGADGAAFIEAHGLTALLVDHAGGERFVGRWTAPGTETAA